MRKKIVLCAEYQGEGATVGTVTGFQLAVDHLIEEAGKENLVDVAIFCLGTVTRTYVHPRFPNVKYCQFAPRLTPQELGPYVSSDALPFLVELFPWRQSIIRSIVTERPDVIHTFQATGSTDLAGVRAAKLLRRLGHNVRVVATVMTEMETYVTHYFESFMAEVLRFAMENSFLAELKAAWQMKGVFRTPGLLIRTYNVLHHVFNYPLCRMAGRMRRKRLERMQSSDHHAIPTQADSSLLRLLRSTTHRHICRVLHRVDAITTSRPRDAAAYGIHSDRVWHMPLSSDENRFYIYEETTHSLRHRLVALSLTAQMETSVFEELIRFLDHVDRDSNCFAIVTVGRLSDEKNVWLLRQSFRELSSLSPSRNIYWLACGSGIGGVDLQQDFGESVFLPGLVPNELLPSIFNMARSRRFVYVSASDTETYGITHEESQRCGLPIVGMELGTRGHFYLQGDRLGGIVLDDEPNAELVENDPMSGKLLVALNGICVADSSQGRGLNAIRNISAEQPNIRCAQHSMTRALFTMATIPADAWARMSHYALTLTQLKCMEWPEIWDLLRTGIYVDNRGRSAELIARHLHTFGPDPDVVPLSEELDAVGLPCASPGY